MALLAKSLILLMCTTVVIEGNKALFHFPGLPPKTTVEIINGLAKTPEELNFHCQSKNDDLGERMVGVGGRSEFEFRPNVIIRTTLYHCTFWWPSDTSPRHFDIYDQRRDEYACVETKDGDAMCSWRIWREGACKYDRCTQNYTDCHSWEHSPAIVASSTANTSHV